MKKSIAVLGSTGSIGTQSLEVIDAYPDNFCLEVITAQNNAKLLIEQAIRYKPNVVVIGNDRLYKEVFNALDPLFIKVYAGEEALSQVVEMDTIDQVIIALVGYAGLKPTIQAIKSNKQIALANKETLVVGGELIQSLLKNSKSRIIPVDSEHSAIFQCLVGEYGNSIEKIYLTASGGPFLSKDAQFLKNVKKEQALSHPNWEMGCKITIDSASLMNKGLEVIEAKWLFDLKADQIDVVIHPQSIIHSMVQFEDGSIKAQMGLPDMKLPIQYALTYPERFHSNFPRLDFIKQSELTFQQPDLKKFRNLALAFEALKQGGNMPCILNASNEILVSLFLKDRIGFLQMPDIIEKCMTKVDLIKNPSYNDLAESDKIARKTTLELVKSI
ncbi:MAG: 1-deoxy-D-xylulose-5-phosphate reductoisomerase [Bacteroidetes bacterium HGW-Bacteroidetes-17]|jgi:1-deoxy-D-xylulose-5-phosphate reductoisomerase|nr:MAG: 1-deoxy-D-xylulose-5-phosphate reductoisomerase [Bacteroidetes bacterium HGW-Bacteroidetes-17]